MSIDGLNVRLDAQHEHAVEDGRGAGYRITKEGIPGGIIRGDGRRIDDHHQGFTIRPSRGFRYLTNQLEGGFWSRQARSQAESNDIDMMLLHPERVNERGVQVLATKEVRRNEQYEKKISAHDQRAPIRKNNHRPSLMVAPPAPG